MTDRILALAQSISPKTIEASRIRDIAAENESRYGESDGRDSKHNTISTRYRDITAGFDNGRCTTRQGTYRCFKRKVAKHEIVDRKCCRTNYK